jgi:hypothetical protein
MRVLIGRAIALMAALALLAPPAWAGTHPPDRNGFMIGFGLGGGSANLKNGDKREGSVTANLRIGYAVRPDLVLHYEGAAWSKTFNEAVGDVTWTFSTNTAALTYYAPGTGLFVRGGFGLGTARVEIKTQGVKVSHDESGFGFLVAAGWEWRLATKFALAPQVQYAYQSLDTLKSSNVVDGSLGFNWYW